MSPVRASNRPSATGLRLTARATAAQSASISKLTILSISQAGYNTAADILVAGCRSIMVPFAEAGETEQSRRAAALERRGLVQVVKEPAVAPDALAEAIDRAMDRGAPGPSGLDLHGAERTPALLLEAVRARRE